MTCLWYKKVPPGPSSYRLSRATCPDGSYALVADTNSQKIRKISFALSG